MVRSHPSPFLKVVQKLRRKGALGWIFIQGWVVGHLGGRAEAKSRAWVAVWSRRKAATVRQKEECSLQCLLQSYQLFWAGGPCSALKDPGSWQILFARISLRRHYHVKRKFLKTVCGRRLDLGPRCVSKTLLWRLNEIICASNIVGHHSECYIM